MEELPEGLEELGYGPRFQEQLCRFLEQSQMFHHFSRPDIEALAPYFHAYHAPAHTRLFTEGSRGNHMWLLVEGKLEVLKDGEGETPKRLAIIRAGKTIGEMALIDQLPHSATVDTLTDATLLLLTTRNFYRIAEENPGLGFRTLLRISQLLSHRLRQTSGVLVDRLD